MKNIAEKLTLVTWFEIWRNDIFKSWTTLYLNSQNFDLHFLGPLETWIRTIFRLMDETKS